MAIIKTISTKNIANLDKYIERGIAHDNLYSNDRNLLPIYGYNLKKDYQGGYDPLYMASQQYALRKISGKEKKKIQGHHLIISFSEKDFPPISDPKNHKSDVQQQAKQALKLVNNLLQKELPKTSQYLIGIQRDGKGHMLHAHIALNSVTTDGKTLNTNLLSLLHQKQQEKVKGKRVTRYKKGLIERTQDFMQDNFEKVTGRAYQRVEMPDEATDISKSSEVMINQNNKYNWKQDLKGMIVSVAQQSTNKNDFVQILNTNGVSIKERRASVGKDKSGKKLYRKAFTYSFKGADGKQHKARDFAYTKTGGIRGLGKAYTPDNLDKIFELVKQKQNQELSSLNIENDLTKVEVQDERSICTTQARNRPEQSEEEEPTYRGEIKRVKTVKIERATQSKLNTEAYDTETEQLQHRNSEEINRQQQQQLQAVERKRIEDERKRKQREREARRRAELERNQHSKTSQGSNYDKRTADQNTQPAVRVKQQPENNYGDFGDFGG